MMFEAGEVYRFSMGDDYEDGVSDRVNIVVMNMERMGERYRLHFLRIGGNDSGPECVVMHKSQLKYFTKLENPDEI